MKIDRRSRNIEFAWFIFRGTLPTLALVGPIWAATTFTQSLPAIIGAILLTALLLIGMECLFYRMDKRQRQREMAAHER